MQEIDAGALLEHLHHEVMLTAVADRGVGERRIRAPRVVDEFLQRVHRQRRIHGEHHLRIDDARHGDKVFHRVERQIGIEVRIDDDLRVGAKKQRVAIRRRLRHHLHRQVAVGAGTVLHHDRLPEPLAERRGDDARDGVVRAARWLRNQDADRPRRILRLRCQRKRGEGQRGD